MRSAADLINRALPTDRTRSGTFLIEHAVDSGGGRGEVVPGGAMASGELSPDLKGKKPVAFVPVRVRQFSQVEVQLVNGVSLRLPAGDVESLKATILIAGRRSTTLNYPPFLGRK